MRIEDPVVSSIYCALTLLPEVSIALADIAKHSECEAPCRRLTADLRTRVDEQDVFAKKDLGDLEVLLSRLRDRIGEGKQRIWVHDEHCISGGWYETVIPPDLALLEEHCLTLDSLRVALRAVRDVVLAHRIAYQMS